MFLSIISALISIFGILFLTHFYLYTRLKKIFKVKKWIIAVVLAGLTASFILMEIVERYFSNWFTNGLYYVISMWLGVLVFLLFGFALLDLVTLILKLFKVKIDYRKIGLALLAFIAALTVYSAINATILRVKKVELAFDNLPNDLKIAQISDVHLGNIYGREYVEKIVALTNEQQPDLILITGDLFDESDGKAAADLAPLKDLKSTYGVYFVTGNHETYAGKDQALELVRQNNITVLTNEVVKIGGIQLVGIEYPNNEMPQANEPLKNLTIDNNIFSLLMYHTPSGIEQTLEKGINLQLSGHTHNGQFFPFSIFPKLIYGYSNGLYKLDNDSFIYVSPGTGTWGPAMRLLSQNEITVFELKKNK
jgi:uncharacterized protein